MSRKRAPGPYNYDDDEDYVPSKAVKYSEREDVGPQKVKKHTLDSDEELDEDEKGGKGVDKDYDILKEEDIDGESVFNFVLSGKGMKNNHDILKEEDTVVMVRVYFVFLFGKGEQRTMTS